MSLEHLSLEAIGAFIDGELAPTEDSAAREHLNQCHACALQVVESQRLKSATSRAAFRSSPPAATMARLEAMAGRHTEKGGRVLPWRSLSWAAVAAGLLLALAFAGMRQYRISDNLSAELLDQHFSVLSDTSSPQVISSDRHTVKPWFQGKLPFSFNIPEPGEMPADTSLVGADLTYLEGKPTAMLLFTIHKHRASIFVAQADAFPSPFLPGARSGFQIIRKNAAGLEFVGVSDVNRSELEALMTVLSKAQ